MQSKIWSERLELLPEIDNDCWISQVQQSFFSFHYQFFYGVYFFSLSQSVFSTHFICFTFYKQDFLLSQFPFYFHPTISTPGIPSETTCRTTISQPVNRLKTCEIRLFYFWIANSFPCIIASLFFSYNTIIKHLNNTDARTPVE